MPSTHSSLHYHLVFSTKHRESWFAPSVRPRLRAYLGGIVKGQDGHPHAVGGTGDHMHLLVGLPPTHRLSDFLRELKAESSAWIRTEFDLAGFAWQEGYGAFTLGAPDLDAASRYVLDQENHHRNRSFQDEYVAMLRRGLVEFDERYLW